MMTKYWKTFFISLGILIVSFILYNKLINIKLPKELSTQLTPIEILLYSGILTTFIILLSLSCKNLYTKYQKINVKQSYSKSIQKIIDMFTHPKSPIHWWSQSLIQLDIFIKNNTPYYTEEQTYIESALNIIGSFVINHKNIAKGCLLVFFYIPQIIICGTFLVDILLYQKFNYFYNSLWLSIFPLFITYILYSIKIMVETNIKNINDILQLTIHDKIMQKVIKGINIIVWGEIRTKFPENLMLCEYQFKDTYIQDHPNIDIRLELEYYFNTLNRLYNINDHVVKPYTIFKSTSYNEIFNIIKYSLNIIGWIYILLYGLI